MRLLIAEDELDLAEALSVFFEKNHFSVDAVHNGLDGYEYGVTGAPFYAEARPISRRFCAAAIRRSPRKRASSLTVSIAPTLRGAPPAAALASAFPSPAASQKATTAPSLPNAPVASLNSPRSSADSKSPPLISYQRRRFYLERPSTSSSEISYFFLRSGRNAILKYLL